MSYLCSSFILKDFYPDFSLGNWALPTRSYILVRTNAGSLWQELIDGLKVGQEVKPEMFPVVKKKQSDFFRSRPFWFVWMLSSKRIKCKLQSKLQLHQLKFDQWGKCTVLAGSVSLMTSITALHFQVLWDSWHLTRDNFSLQIPKMKVNLDRKIPYIKNDL